MCHTTFLNTIKPLLGTYRWIGMLPIAGMKHCKGDSLKYSVKSVYFVFCSLPAIIMHLFLAGLKVYECFIKGLSLHNLSGLYFWVGGAVSTCLHHTSLMNLNKTVQKMKSIESSLPSITNQKHIMNRVNYVLALTLLTAIGDHIFYLFLTSVAVKCNLIANDSGLYLKSYLKEYFSFVFITIRFNYPLGILCQIIKLQTSLIWCLNDAFTISTSMYLENAFQQFNNQIFQRNAKFIKRRLNWSDLRDQYTHLSKLVRTVNKHISSVIFINFTSNIFIFCLHIFFVIGKYQIPVKLLPAEYKCYKRNGIDVLNSTQIYVSTSLLMLRTISVLFTAARFHKTSRKPLKVLGLIPSCEYNYETHRFMEQVYHSKIALSGLGLFYLTHETILSVFGVLVTYELVLFQM